MATDVKLLFGSKLDAQDGNPTIKMKHLAKLIELKDKILMTYVIYGEQEIRNLGGAHLCRNILQVSFNTDLITFSFCLLFKN